MEQCLKDALAAQQEATIGFLALQRQKSLAEIVKLSKGFSETDDFGSTMEFTFRLLCDRAVGVMALIGQNLLWDAEIVLRSYYECAIKILFFTHSKEADRATLINEFWNLMGGVADKRRARKAKSAEKVFSESDLSSRRTFALLQKNYMQRPVDGLNKRERNILEQKWSFSKIADILDYSSGRSTTNGSFQSLLHIYGMASHLAHSDSTAIDLMLDRALRSREEAALLAATQASRMMSDLVSLGLFCTSSIYRALRIETSIDDELRKLADAAMSLGKPVSAAFAETQNDFYDHWLARDADQTNG